MLLAAWQSAWAGETTANKAMRSGSDSAWYVGVAAGSLRYQQNGLHEFSMQDRRLILGKQFNRALAVEAHLGNGASDTEMISGVPATLKVNLYAAAFVKARLTFAPRDWGEKRLHLYGMLGGSRVDTTSSDPGTTRSGVQTGVAAGVGLELDFRNIAVQLGYTRYINGNANNVDYSLDSLHLGVLYQFRGEASHAN